jgi:predicted nucleic acid-binding protein
MKFVIDTNIAAALLLKLSYSEAARQAVSEASALIAPDLILHEMANLLWRLTTADRIDVSLAHRVLEETPVLLSDCIPGHELLPESFDLAVSLAHPAYDCFFVRAAAREGAVLLTADRRLARSLEDAQTSVRCRLVAA